MLSPVPFARPFITAAYRTVADERQPRAWHRRGFTLVEMMVALGVFGFLTTAAFVGLGRLSPQFDIDNGVRTVAMDLQQARVQAITRGHSINVAFSSYDLTVSDANQSGTTLTQGKLPKSLSMSASPSVATFTPLGTLITPLTIAVTNGSQTRYVTVGIIGEVQTQ